MECDPVEQHHLIEEHMQMLRLDSVEPRHLIEEHVQMLRFVAELDPPAVRLRVRVSNGELHANFCSRDRRHPGEARCTPLVYLVDQAPRHLKQPVRKIVAMFRWLLRSGADPQLRDGAGWTAAERLDALIAQRDTRSPPAVLRRYEQLRHELSAAGLLTTPASTAPVSDSKSE